ncbi:M48 family metallopeptidase [Natronolimnobius baerhuensis]|uniref:Peptidase M48 domain-containing protein n=1 Tax=Natronolimnobius baerhuensis TaxID=253108 RepID=A0A202E8Z5_9EURY|nr:M48 family metallopeptidase [Natronolimnobius baerhuensis]OVE84679.1 hypothetical protein B2G88_09830 [Natronolimnobius baerhuensis]
MIDLTHPLASIAVATVIGWLILVVFLWSVYRWLVVSESDKAVISGRIRSISETVSTGCLFAGAAFAGYVSLSLPDGLGHAAAFVGGFAVAGTVLSSANLVALSAHGILEYTWIERPRDGVRAIILSGAGTYGGMAVVAAILVTAPIAILGLVAVGIPTHYALGPWLIEQRATAKPVPQHLEQRWQRLAVDAGCDDITFRIVTGSGSAAAAAVGIVPGRRLIYVTETLTQKVPDDELETVVGHELGHVRNRHLEKRVLGSTILWTGIVAGIVSLFSPLPEATFYVLVGAIIGYLFYRKRLVQHEYEADAVAVDLTSPDAVTRGLERITELEGRPRETSREYDFLTSHPSTARRVRRLENA